MEAAGVCWWLVAKGVISWTELTEKMSIVDVERVAHAYIAVKAAEYRMNKRTAPKTKGRPR